MSVVISEMTSRPFESFNVPIRTNGSLHVEQFTTSPCSIAASNDDRQLSRRAARSQVVLPFGSLSFSIVFLNR